MFEMMIVYPMYYEQNVSKADDKKTFAANNCGSSISASIPEAHRIIMEFRNSLWVDPDSSALNVNRTLLGKDHRIILLINELFKLQIESGEIEFTIGRAKVRIVL